MKTEPIQYSVAQTGPDVAPRGACVLPTSPHRISGNSLLSDTKRSGLRLDFPLWPGRQPALQEPGSSRWEQHSGLRRGVGVHLLWVSQLKAPGCQSWQVPRWMHAQHLSPSFCPATLSVMQQALPRSRLFSALPSSLVLEHSFSELAREQNLSSGPQPGRTPAFHSCRARYAPPPPQLHTGCPTAVSFLSTENGNPAESELHGTPATILLSVCFVLPQFRVCTNVQLLLVPCLPCYCYYRCFQSLPFSRTAPVVGGQPVSVQIPRSLPRKPQVTDSSPVWASGSPQCFLTTNKAASTTLYIRNSGQLADTN